MALATPTTEGIANNIIAQVEGTLQQSIPLLPRAFTRVLAKALAGVYVLLYRYAGWMFLQQFVQHASADETIINGRRVRPLVEWGRLVGEPDPHAATRAELDVDVNVHTQVGQLSAGTQLVREDSGVVYQVIVDVPLDASVITVRVRAVSDQDGNGGAGSVGNLEVGDVLKFATKQDNVGVDVVVVDTAVAGVDAEASEVYRARVLRRFRRTPQGGAPSHLVAWGEEAAGVVAAYPYTGSPGEVDIYIEVGDGDGVPNQTQLDAAKAAIEVDVDGLASRRPAGCFVNVLPIRRTAFDIVVHGLDPDTVELRAAIESGLDEHLRSREPFIVGVSSLPRTDRITHAGVSGVVDTIVNAAGAGVVRVEIREGVMPITSRQLRKGEKARLGTVI